MLLVRQFRQAVGRKTLELPGGKIGLHEDPMAAAKREFMEETGREIGKCSQLLVLDNDLSTSFHRTFVFFSTDVARKPFRESELSVEAIALSKCLRKVQNQEITHGPTVAAILAINHLGNLYD